MPDYGSKISVCIPTYNGSKYIKAQLESILVQLGQDDEVVISDDSSDDDTINIIESIADGRIKVLKDNCYASPIFNLENALKYASGDYIFLSDQDDLWVDGKVTTMLSALKTHSTVVSDCVIVDECGATIESSFYEINKSKAGFFNNLFTNSYLGCCMAFDKEMLKNILPFPRRIAMHDIWIGLISELLGNPVFIKEKLVHYRRHSENFSPTSESSRFSLSYKIFYRYLFVYYCLVRVVRLRMLSSRR